MRAGARRGAEDFHFRCAQPVVAPRELDPAGAGKEKVARQKKASLIGAT